MTSFIDRLGFSRRRGQAQATENTETVRLDAVDDLEARSKEAQKALRHAATNAEQVIEALLSQRAAHRTTKAN